MTGKKAAIVAVLVCAFAKVRHRAHGDHGRQAGINLVTVSLDVAIMPTVAKIVGKYGK